MSKTPRTQQLIDIANDEGISDGGLALALQEHAELLETELADKDRQLVEARARLDILERAYDSLIEEQASLCAKGQSITELVAAKCRRIEQMREVLKALRWRQKGAGDE